MVEQLYKVPYGMSNFLYRNKHGDVFYAQGKLGTLNTADANYAILAPYNEDNAHSLNGTYSTEYSADL